MDFDIDTIVRNGSTDYVERPGTLDVACQNSLMFLSTVKHLAFGFNLMHQDVSAYFVPIQTHCPNLETLRVFTPLVTLYQPTETAPSSNHSLIDSNSNFKDLITFYSNRKKCEKKAGAKVIHRLASLDVLADFFLEIDSTDAFKRMDSGSGSLLSKFLYSSDGMIDLNVGCQET